MITPTGVVAPILSEFDGGYWVRTPCFGVGVVRGGTRIDSADVVIDPGHGGPELGAVGANGLEEKEVNLGASQVATNELERSGLTVVLTRSDDEYFLTVRTRAEIATALAAKVLVSVHHNSGGPPPSEIPGSEMFFQIGEADSERLAHLLDEEVLAAFTPFDVDWVRGDAGAKFRQGDDGDYFGILRFSKPVTAVLTESAFMSNPSEAEFLATAEARDAEGVAIARGILRFLDGSRSSTTTTSSTLDSSIPTTVAPTTVPGTMPLYGPAGDANGCIDPDMY